MTFMFTEQMPVFTESRPEAQRQTGLAGPMEPTQERGRFSEHSNGCKEVSDDVFKLSKDSLGI